MSTEIEDNVGFKHEAIKLDEATGKYITASGILVPRVHDVLKQAGHLRDYSNPYYMERGRQAHLATELYDRGELDEETLGATLRPYLEAWKLFKKENSVEVLEIEKLVYCPLYGVGGRLDRALKIKNQKLLADIKTGEPEKWTGIQLAAYQSLDCHDCQKILEPYDLRVVVQLKDDGTFRVHDFSDDQHQDGWEGALATYQWRRHFKCLKT